MNDSDRILEILKFWIGTLDADGMPDPTRNKLWFQATADDDRIIEQTFGADVNRAIAGALDHWSDTSEGLVALILLLDQFPRNINRGTDAAFSGDERALMFARAAVDKGLDRETPTIGRIFLYIPFEHAEDLAAQQEGLACFDQLLASCPEGARERVSGFRDYMVAHLEVIEKFGRFPHRNSILGRESTDAELSHLELHGGF